MNENKEKEVVDFELPELEEGPKATCRVGGPGESGCESCEG